MIILDPLMHWTDSCTWAKNGQAWAKIGFFQDFIDSFSVIVMLLLHLMGAGSNVVHKLRRKLDHLLFNIISSQNWPLSSSFHLGDSNFCNLYEYNWFVKNLSCGYLKFAPFADNRYTQQHARSFSSFSLPLFKSHHKKPAYCFPGSLVSSCLTGFCNIHTSQQLSTAPLEHNNVGSMASTEVTGVPKSKKKKLKGKRAVVRWLKFFRWKKKKEYERMTLEEKVLYKLKKARKKEERLVEALNKIEPKDSLITTHDPEVLTPEEHFYLLKLGKKCKNYVPVGRRGIFQGVILNMHLHWKKHQTLKVVVKTFTQEEVREIATELARLSGGIVLDIDEDNTIIMYRGKNYSQPPTEIMSPKVTLTRKKALDKSKYRDALHAVRRFIPKLEQDLEDLHEGMKQKPKLTNEEVATVFNQKRKTSKLTLQNFDGFEVDDKTRLLEEKEPGIDVFDNYESLTRSGSSSEPENLSDIFETDSDEGVEDDDKHPLYLEQIEKFPSEDDDEPEDFQEHLRRISAAARREEVDEKELKVEELDDIDKIFLRASSLLKRKR